MMIVTSRLKNAVWGCLLSCSIILCDQISKWYIFEYVPSLFVFSWLRFDALENYGMSWGFMHETFQQQPQWGLGVVSLVVLLFVWYTGVKVYEGKVAVGEFLVLGGAISNVIDRLLFGAVRDFIHIFWGNWSFPIFNLADIAIVSGIAFILCEGLLSND